MKSRRDRDGRVRPTLRIGTLLSGVMISMAVQCLAFAAPGQNDRPNGAFLAAASDFRARFILPSGRVVDDHNGGVSHSESQGYGMLIAALADDRATFDLIWDWTRSALMVRGDGLAAWKWDPRSDPPVSDLNNATDGDLIIAWALAEAADRWGGRYRGESRSLAQAIASKLVFSGEFGPLLKPGAAGFSAEEWPGGPVVNLSYWVFPALTKLAADDGAGPWQDLVASGLRLLDASRFGPAALPSDWISIAGRPAPAPGKPAVFGYDAVRTPLYVLWAFPEDQDRLGPSRRAVIEGELQRVDLSSGAPLGAFGGQGFRTLSEALACSRPAPGLASPPNAAGGSYYASVIGALSQYVIGQRSPCGS